MAGRERTRASASKRTIRSSSGPSSPTSAARRLDPGEPRRGVARPQHLDRHRLEGQHRGHGVALRLVAVGFLDERSGGRGGRRRRPQRHHPAGRPSAARRCPRRPSRAGLQHHARLQPAVPGLGDAHEPPVGGQAACRAVLRVELQPAAGETSACSRSSSVRAGQVAERVGRACGPTGQVAGHRVGGTRRPSTANEADRRPPQRPRSRPRSRASRRGRGPGSGCRCPSSSATSSSASPCVVGAQPRARGSRTRRGSSSTVSPARASA